MNCFINAVNTLKLEMDILKYKSVDGHNLDTILNNYSHVILRFSGQYSEIKEDIIKKCHDKGIKLLDSGLYFNSIYNKSFDYRSKIDCARLYQENDLPYLPAISFMSIHDYLNIINTIEQKLGGYPVYVKEAVSSHGEGNYLIANEDDFLNFFIEHEINNFLIQKHAPEYISYRVNYIHQQIVGGIIPTRKEINRSKPFKALGLLNNGESVIINQGHKYFNPINDICRKTAELLMADYLGIDIMITYDKDNSLNPYLQEANINPQFAFSQSHMIVDIATEILKPIVN